LCQSSAHGNRPLVADGGRDDYMEVTVEKSDRLLSHSP
jgi:hypothetical protein